MSFLANRVTISHPLANQISMIPEAVDGCMELAFFQDNKWVLDILAEFAGYNDGSLADTTSYTLVYRYVPNYLVSAFLVEYAVGNEA